MALPVVAGGAMLCEVDDRGRIVDVGAFAVTAARKLVAVSAGKAAVAGTATCSAPPEGDQHMKLESTVAKANAIVDAADGALLDWQREVALSGTRLRVRRLAAELWRIHRFACGRRLRPSRESTHRVGARSVIAAPRAGAGVPPTDAVAVDMPRVLA